MSSTAADAALVRANRRLRVTLGALVGVVLALCVYLIVGTGGRNSGEPPTSQARSVVHTSSTVAHRTRLNSKKGAVRTPRPTLLVAVTTGGVVEVLNPSTGEPVRTLATGATGDELSVTADGSEVYFETDSGCMGAIERVPVDGGTPEQVATGSLPSLSQDGSELAYVREPLVNQGSCQGQLGSPSSYTVVVRDVATGSESTYPISPQLAGAAPDPIDHLSWSYDDRQLAVSVDASGNGADWQLSVIDPATDEYYFSGRAVPVTGTESSSSYYREGVFVPDGDMFVNRVCCGGPNGAVTSSLLVEISPENGKILRQVAIGITTNSHTSLDSDRSGHWLLYLSGGELLVSENGNRPTELASGFAAAAW